MRHASSKLWREVCCHRMSSLLPSQWHSVPLQHWACAADRKGGNCCSRRPHKHNSIIAHEESWQLYSSEYNDLSSSCRGYIYVCMAAGCLINLCIGYFMLHWIIHECKPVVCVYSTLRELAHLKTVWNLGLLSTALFTLDFLHPQTNRQSTVHALE